MSPHSIPDEAPSWFVVKVTALASLGGCLFGYDLGAISGALPQLADSFDLTESQQEWVVSILYLGAGLGAAVGGTVCDRMGRQKTILGTDVVFVLGAAWLYWAGSYAHVLVGRFVVGVAVAVSGVADVSYLHEIAPLDWRGAIVSVNEACISLGFLLAYVAAYVYSSADDEEWRIIFGWAGVLALVQLIGMRNMPESPVWLAQQGRTEESRQAWLTINDGAIPPATLSRHNSSSGLAPRDEDHGLDGNAEDPLAEPTYQHPQEPCPDDDDDVETRSFASVGNSFSACSRARDGVEGVVLMLSRYRRQVWIAIFLAVTQQFCGQTSVLNYAPHILAEAAGKDDPPAWSTVAIGSVKFLVTVLVIWRIEFVGRRNLLLGGMALISLGLLALVVAFGGSGSEDPDSWTTNLATFDLALPGSLLVVCGYSVSFGPLTWLLTSELFPTSIRGRALGATTILTNLCASFVTRTFLSASLALGPARVFAIYCVVTTCGILFAYLAIPDTGGKTVEHVEEALQTMSWWRFDAMVVPQEADDDPEVDAPAREHHLRQSNSNSSIVLEMRSGAVGAPREIL